MSFWSSLFAWGDVPFVISLGAAVGFALLQMSGILGALSGEADVEGDADADVHAEVDAHAHVEAHAEVAADAEGDVDANGDGEGMPVGWAHALLVGAGVGKAPLFVLGETFCVVFALAGIALNTPYGADGAPSHSLAWTVPIALIVAYLTTSGIAGLLGRLLGVVGEPSSRAGLVGLSGVVISRRVDGDFGEVRLRDRSGHVVRVICRAENGEIPGGREVVVVDEDARDRRLVVAALDVRAP